jgi:TolA-binding protein
MKLLPAFFCFALFAFALSSCSTITVMRTKEMKAVSDSSAASVNKRLDSLMLVIDSLKVEQARGLSRLKADVAEINSKIGEQGKASESRMEEISFRLDRLLGVTQKKTVAKAAAAPEKNLEVEQKNHEMEILYNASRSDYLRGEYAVAYNGFKQIYETLKTGETAENALYWMGMCMLDANKKENAVTLFRSLLEKFPQSLKVCSVNFKLASMAEEAKNVAEQKAYLQKLLGTEHCVSSNEFQRAAEILQGK